MEGRRRKETMEGDRKNKRREENLQDEDTKHKNECLVCGVRRKTTKDEACHAKRITKNEGKKQILKKGIKSTSVSLLLSFFFPVHFEKAVVYLIHTGFVEGLVRHLHCFSSFLWRGPLVCLRVLSEGDIRTTTHG